jgi:ribonuclease P protein component
LKKLFFPKSFRLLKTRQFKKVGKYGRQFSGCYLSIQICENRKSNLKLGLTVSRKFGKAAQRNHFKRLVREAFRLSQHQLPQFYHLNVRPTKNYTPTTLNNIKNELLQLCQKAQSVSTIDPNKILG